MTVDVGIGSSLWWRWRRFTNSASAMTDVELFAVAADQDRIAENSTDTWTIRLACAEHDLALATARYIRVYKEVSG